MDGSTPHPTMAPAQRKFLCAKRKFCPKNRHPQKDGGVVDPIGLQGFPVSILGSAVFSLQKFAQKKRKTPPQASTRPDLQGARPTHLPVTKKN